MKLKILVCAALLTGLPLQRGIMAAPKTSQSKQRKLDTALHKAAFEGNLAQVKAALSRGGHINAPDADGNTAVHAACQNESMLAYLLQKGGNVNALNKYGQTALMFVTMTDQLAVANQSRIVKRLLNAGAKLNLRNISGQTALTLALDAGRFETARLLIDRGADANIPDDKGETPLMKAAAGILLPMDGDKDKERAEMLALLLKKGAKANAADEEGRTALMWASIFDCAAGAKVLIKAGAKVNAADGEGRTPLMHAVEGSHLEVVRVLLQNGADVSMKNKSGQTVLSMARNELRAAKTGEIIGFDVTELEALVTELDAAEKAAKAAKGKSAGQ